MEVIALVKDKLESVKHTTFKFRDKVNLGGTNYVFLCFTPWGWVIASDHGECLRCGYGTEQFFMLEKGWLPLEAKRNRK